MPANSFLIADVELVSIKPSGHGNSGAGPRKGVPGTVTFEDKKPDDNKRKRRHRGM